MPESLADVLKSVPPHELEGVIYSGNLHEIHMDGCKHCLVERVLRAVVQRRVSEYGDEDGWTVTCLETIAIECAEAGLDVWRYPENCHTIGKYGDQCNRRGVLNGLCRQHSEIKARAAGLLGD